MTARALSSAVIVLVSAACGAGAREPEAPAGPHTSSIGGPCASDVECPATYTCDKDDPGGECSRKCATSADCGSGGTCTPENECLASCQTNADCTRPSYACVGKGPDSYCDIPESSEKP